MNIREGAKLSFAVMMAMSTACGANPLGKAATPEGATSTGSTIIITPELQNADARVKQAGNQLELAKKQLKAAQSILKAAEADLKAAKAERAAIALRTQAQGLAQEAGMKPEGNKALAEADSAAVTAKNGGSSSEGAAPPEPGADRVVPQLDLR